MNMEQRDFDKEAASWDEHPTRTNLAKEIGNAIVKHVAVTSDMDALDFGCGTGLLTMQLQPLVRSITGADSSQGMLKIFNAKRAGLQLANVKSLLCDLDKGDTLSGRYHLVVSAMTLHHIKEIAPLLRQCNSVMVPGATLCLADLDLEGGQFHEDNTGVFHFGFDRSTLHAILDDAGFVDVAVVTAAEIEKLAGDGTTKRFTVFLMTARKG